MSDVFFEVDEQLRSERLRTLFRKSWPFALGIALVALGLALAYWGWSAWRQNSSERASDAYAQGLDALTKGDNKAAEAKFAEVSGSATPAYKTLSLMQQAGLRIGEHKDADAVSLLDQAAKAAPSPVLADAATLKAAMILMDKRPLDEIEARLNPLAQQDRPYRWLARETLGLAKLQAGKLKEARGDFAVLSLAQDVSDTSRNRARAAMALIDDATASSLAGLVKAGLDAPPAPAIPSMPLGGSPTQTPTTNGPQGAPAGAAR